MSDDKPRKKSTSTVKVSELDPKQVSESVPEPSAEIPGELARIFGENLRIARLELRMTQDELSRLSGVGVKSISQIENGANVTLNTVERLARHVQAPPVELLTPRRRRPR
jgi:DNA-binding XRE family transcriptional regulator